MASPLLETKLYVPRGRGDRVPRPRLAERLDRGAAGKLTLVSAPAGFGKTTLLAEWLAAGGRTAAAWVSLDEGDNHPPTFWRYVVAALRRARPGVGADALTRLEEPQPPIEALLAGLLNELAALAGDVVLVLDDYHLVEAPEVQEGVAFLVEHLPPTLHLVIASRADPALPLPRLRARGDLVEIRAADLRFTPGEAAAYLNEAMGLALRPRDVAALEERTEGWIAALQLAALSMRGRDDAAGFIASFAGDDRYVVDYLVEEVLQRQPGRVRRFLLETAVLDRMSGPLCDAVTGRDGGRATLEALERGNLFLVPLDDRRRWYRYHHLFVDVLRAHLAEAEPDAVPELHRRASAWHARNGEPADAVRHALAAGDFPGAANLVEVAAPALLRSRQEATVLAWLSALPDEVFHDRPVLSDAYAGVLLQTGQMDGVEERLRDAERWVEAAAGTHPPRDARPGGVVVASDEGLRRLAGSVAMHRAGQALILGDVDRTVAHAQRALERAPEDDDLVRGGAAALLGLAAWRRGDLDAAYGNYAECMARLRRAGHVADTFGCALVLADIEVAQGRLREAMRTFERALQLATVGGGPPLRGAADMHVGMAALHRERDDLASAAQHLSRSEELGEHAGLPQNRYRWRLVMARVRLARGDLDGALEMLDEAERAYDGDFFPDVRPIGAWRARVWAAQGRLGEALGWARERGLSADDDLSYLREFEHATLARVLLARSRGERSGRPLEDATRLLERLLRAAEDGGRISSVVEALALLALARQMGGDARSALASLERALVLAEPEDYVRMFVDEGAPMASLLSEAAKRGPAPAYARRLLAALGAGESRAVPRQDLVEPLSERELDVLRLLGTHLNGPDIAGELVVSVNTLRTHTKNIFAKLGVNNRRDAVRRADELGLVRSAQHQPGAAQIRGA